MKIYFIGLPNKYSKHIWLFCRWKSSDINGKVTMNGFRIFGFNFEFDCK